MDNRDWEKDKGHHSYFETEQSKRLTRLFWASRNLESELRDMGFTFV